MLWDLHTSGFEIEQGLREHIERRLTSLSCDSARAS